MSLIWRIIESAPSQADFNMALDEAISLSVRKGLSPPTIRFYRWEKTSVTVGYFQKIEEINTTYCKERNIPIIRRITGGRAVVHGGDLTYSISAPIDKRLFSGSIYRNYENISRAFIIGLRSIGLPIEVQRKTLSGRELKKPSCFGAVSFSEITVHGKKVIGSAQKKWHDAIMQQGSIMMDINRQELCEIFNIEKHSGIGGLREFMPSLSIEALKRAIIDGFNEAFGVEMVRGEPTEDELNMAVELRDKKYSLHTWNYRR